MTDIGDSTYIYTTDLGNAVTVGVTSSAPC